MSEQHPQPNHRSFLRFLFLWLGIAAIGVYSYFPVRAGYEQGVKAPCEVLMGGLLTLPALLLVVTAILAWARIVSRCGRSDISSAVVLLLLALGLGWPSLKAAAEVHGEVAGGSRLSRSRGEIRSIYEALTMYRQQHSAYPTTLAQLPPDPKSANLIGIARERAIEARSEVQYFLNDEDQVASGSAYLIWMTGPDQNLDIQAGPELRKALMETDSDKVSPWLVAMTYDPSNGASGGDLWRTNHDQSGR